jgi:hypothetical protein
MLVAGALTHGARRGVLLGGGLTLVTLASLELSIREHFAGYRSHSALLSGTAGVAVMAGLAFLTGLPRYVVLVAGLSVFLFAFRALRAAFQGRSGGFGFRA